MDVAASAGINVCLRKVDPTKIFELIRKHGVTHMAGAPIVYNSLINAPDAPKRRGRTARRRIDRRAQHRRLPCSRAPKASASSSRMSTA